MSLHLLNRGKRWCFPGAIALVTDVDYAAVVEACYTAKRRVRGQRIRGVGAMTAREGKVALHLLGWETDAVDMRGSLRSVLRRLPRDGRYIVRWSGHVAVVRGHDIADSNGATPGVWSREECPYNRRRVTWVWHCEPKDTPCTSTQVHTRPDRT